MLVQVTVMVCGPLASVSESLVLDDGLPLTVQVVPLGIELPPSTV